MSTYFRRTITNTSVASTLLWAPEDVKIPTMDGQNPLKQRLIHLLNYHLGTPHGVPWIYFVTQSFPETFQPTDRPENSSSKPYLQHAFEVSGFVSREIQSGQIIIFHQPRFPWNKGISLTKPPFGVRSCAVAIIWPDPMIAHNLTYPLVSPIT